MAVEQKEKLVGRVTHFFGHINVGIVELDEPLQVGDTIHIKGHTTDFVQTIDSIQLEHHQVQQGSTGQSIGIRVDQHVREGDLVYLAG